MKPTILIQNPKLNRRSRADRRTAVIISTFLALNSQFVKNDELEKLIRKSQYFYTSDWTHEEANAMTGKLVVLFLQVESDPIFIYAYIDTWAQEMLEKVRNPQKRLFWLDVYRYTSAKLEELEFAEDLYEDADRFFHEANRVIDIRP